MDHFNYRQGRLCCEQVPVERIADEVGTPAYVYSTATLHHHFDQFTTAFAELNPLICYAVKSCHNLAICRLLHERGAGFDVVSGGEIHRVLRVGADPAKIVYAGVGKTDAEIAQAIEAGIGWFNVESEAEMQNLIRIAARHEKTLRAALRVNPDVDPRTHRYTATGKKETKFGVDLERARRFFESYGRDRWVRLTGIHLHIGSLVNTIEPYVDAVSKALELIDELAADGFAIEMLDIGGGYGAHYESTDAPPPAAYAEAIVPLLRGRGLQIVLEPGRSITANAGILLTRVLYTKESGDRQFVIVDAGMTDLLRPALYEAYHFVWPAKVSSEFVPTSRDNREPFDGAILADVVGPVCESGDFLAKDRYLPPVQRGDLLAVFSAGAYGFVMASQYNSRPRPPEILVSTDAFKTVRQRETYDDLLRGER